ncbi:MAG: hypothetical protein M3Q23_13480 [Actinomycetota bacterium]|nr:hypothetical protein [Actinomycetota bacterium]
MTDRTRVRLGVAVWAVSIAMVLAAFGLLFVAVNSVAYIGAITLMFSTVGVLVVRAQPRNRIGWVLLAIGGCYAYLVFSAEYGTAAVAHHWPLPADRELLWAGLWSWAPALGMTATFLFLLFPDGHLPSGRWRWVGWLSGLAISAATAGYAAGAAPIVFRASPRQFADMARHRLPNLQAGPVPQAVFEIGVLVGAVCMVASVVATVVRLRRSTGREHQQLQWFTYGAIALAAGLAGSFGQSALVSALVPAFGFTWFTVCVAVAMLRYRLYDIDRIVNRTLVYGAVTALLAAVYAGLAVGLGSVVGSNQNSLVIAGSTLVVAALFRPVRGRIQGFIDRRFYRRKYDAVRTLEAFTSRLRDEVDMEELREHLLGVVAETMQPDHASLWLRVSETAR